MANPMPTRCAKCSEMMFSDRHACAPEWEVERAWGHVDRPEWRPTRHNVFALYADQAAERWAEEYDRDGDYIILNGAPVRVRVRKVVADEDGWQVFDLSGESEPVYHATPATEVHHQGNGFK